LDQTYSDVFREGSNAKFDAIKTGEFEVPHDTSELIFSFLVCKNKDMRPKIAAMFAHQENDLNASTLSSQKVNLQMQESQFAMDFIAMMVSIFQSITDRRWHCLVKMAPEKQL
jgi:hypothetical protein